MGDLMSLILAGATSGATTLSATDAVTSVITLPSTTDTLIGKATTDTLTNKTLTGAVFTAMPATTTAQSMIRLNTANGYGSTNLAIMRFTNVVTNQGSDITYADSATLGGSFTINTNGVYAVSFSASFVGASDMGVTINTVNPTTSINVSVVTEKLCHSVTPTVNSNNCVAATAYLTSGMVLRAHCDPTNAAGTRLALFTITRVA